MVVGRNMRRSMILCFALFFGLPKIAISQTVMDDIEKIETKKENKIEPNLRSNPDMVAKEINKYISEGRIDDATNDLFKRLTQGSRLGETLQWQDLSTKLRSITAYGSPNIVDELQDVEYGSSVVVKIYHMDFPLPLDKINLRHVFFRYTFMKDDAGWSLTDFAFAPSGTYPPPGWIPYR
ncbi:hypothetical protein [Methylovirgula sp. 4M-Z18]|uniref:hypothetical protein n=1 Tax=Methylovirgula sp. 4M-Z18 TaxID=2293567 RepID=UPI000E39C262|nr:hypothetical protein [Methylovirgula sp. 4M-Z18]RFB78580.1 hypothetical protein DYH55_15335 [Methylovirgula sp. 4M-Z18]